MARKTDSSNPADWIFIAESDLDGVKHLIAAEKAYALCVSKLAEILEKVLKAELIRSGWFLEKTHDLFSQCTDDQRLAHGVRDTFGL